MNDLAPRPSIVTLMAACCWIAMVLGIVTVAFTIYCASVLPGTGAAAEFAAGFVESAGFDPAAFGATEAGEMSSVAIITLVAAGLAIIGIRRRRLTMTRFSAVVWLLFAVVSAAVLGAGLALAVLAGSFTAEVKRWFEAAPLSLGSLEPDSSSARP